VPFEVQGLDIITPPPAAKLLYEFLDKDSQVLYQKEVYLSEKALASWEVLSIGENLLGDGKVRISLVNQSEQAAYFDELEIVISQKATAKIVQENHYYPFGLNMVGIEKVGKPDDKFQYNAQSEKEESIGIYETPFRGYDAQLGIFRQVDLLAPLFSSITPFHFGYNNPVSLNDPTGLCPECEENNKNPNAGDTYTSSGGALYTYDNKNGWVREGGMLEEVEVSAESTQAKPTLKEQVFGSEGKAPAWAISLGSVFSGVETHQGGNAHEFAKTLTEFNPLNSWYVLYSGQNLFGGEASRGMAALGVVPIGGVTTRTINAKQAHHIVPKALKKWWSKYSSPQVRKLIALAEEGGFKFDSSDNLMGLEKYVKATGYGVHGNHPAYNKYVYGKVTSIFTLLNTKGALNAKDGLNATNAASELRYLVTELRITIDNAVNSGLADDVTQNLNKLFGGN